MTSKYITQPPLYLGRGSGGSFGRQVLRICRTILRILWQTFVPYNPRPEEPASLPAPASTLDSEQVRQCQWIFDQTEARRDHLEQKAQWTFALILFLAPLVASIFVFLIREEASNSASRMVALCLLLSSVVLMLFAFISIVRAISVQARETLFLGAAVDLDSGQFAAYDAGRHAGGLLYCASVNTAMNDHIAQFVKGAHILTTAAVVLLLVAMVPAVSGFSSLQNHPIQTKIIGAVEISPTNISAIRIELAEIRRSLATLGTDKRLQHRLDALEARLDKIELETHAESRHWSGAKP